MLEVPNTCYSQQYSELADGPVTIRLIVLCVDCSLRSISPSLKATEPLVEIYQCYDAIELRRLCVYGMPDYFFELSIHLVLRRNE